MLGLAFVIVIVAVLAGCGGMATPAYATPCEVFGHASQQCQIYMYNRAGG